MKHLDGWNGEIASKLVEFLIAFRDFSEEFQAKIHQTIQLVLVRYYDLLEKCSTKDEEEADDDPIDDIV